MANLAAKDGHLERGECTEWNGSTRLASLEWPLIAISRHAPADDDQWQTICQRSNAREDVLENKRMLKSRSWSKEKGEKGGGRICKSFTGNWPCVCVCVL